MKKKNTWLKERDRYGSISHHIPLGSSLIEGDAEQLKVMARNFGIDFALHRIGWQREGVSGKYLPIYDGILVGNQDCHVFAETLVQKKKEASNDSTSPASSLKEFNLRTLIKKHSLEGCFTSSFELELAGKAWERSLKKHGIVWRWVHGIEFRFNLKEVLDKVTDEYLSDLGGSVQLAF